MRKLENKKVDDIGRAIVKASALPAQEIDRIVSGEMLFDSVRKMITLESTGKRVGRSWVRHTVMALSACAVLVAGGAFFYFSPGRVDIIADRAIPAAEAPGVRRFAEPDRIADTDELPVPVAMPRPERAARVVATKINRPERRTARQYTPEDDFYALSYAGDPNETERGGRIVRVDLPRTVLFAMGVDIPLENEVETVKADLLIGNDGVTRAIRVIK